MAPPIAVPHSLKHVELQSETDGSSAARPTAQVAARSISSLILRSVLVIAALLGSVHVAIELTWRFRHSISPSLRELFVMNAEGSIVTWVTIFLTGALGMACVATGCVQRRKAWYAVGAFFLYLSMDDATMLHERIGWLIEARIGDTGASYRWIQFLGPVFAIVGLAIFGFFWRMFETCRACRRCALLGFACLGSALCFEVFEKMWFHSGMRIRGFSVHLYTIVPEELLELLGPALLLACVLRFHEEGHARARA